MDNENLNEEPNRSKEDSIENEDDLITRFYNASAVKEGGKLITFVRNLKKTGLDGWAILDKPLRQLTKAKYISQGAIKKLAATRADHNNEPDSIFKILENEAEFQELGGRIVYTCSKGGVRYSGIIESVKPPFKN